jgi:hypothetical protein
MIIMAINPVIILFLVLIAFAPLRSLKIFAVLLFTARKNFFAVTVSEAASAGDELLHLCLAFAACTKKMGRLFSRFEGRIVQQIQSVTLSAAEKALLGGNERRREIEREIASTTMRA